MFSYIVFLCFTNFIEVFANSQFDRNSSHISDFLFGGLHLFPKFFLNLLET